ncbi:MAG: elongation factor P [Patescibacteria group bacterium]|nr:elongation factor P [Patescibacteria group bacterium]
MLTINDLKNGSLIMIEGDPYVVMSVSHQHIGRGGSSIQTRVRNLRSGRVFEKNFKPADEFAEAEIEKMPSRFLYKSRGEIWFDEVGNPKNRFILKEEVVGESEIYLKPNMEVTAIKLMQGDEEKILNVELPIKAEYKVVEAPPAIRGNTAQGGTKVVTIEGGATVNAPLFINQDDVIRINTQTGEYVERVEKA